MFADFQGAFHCLVEGGGDVAFVRHTTSFENTGKCDANDANLFALPAKLMNFFAQI